MADSFTITLNSLGRSYSIPVGGGTDWRNGVSRYLRDSATVINSAASGSLVTPVFNVKTYGATGNGSTDDTVSIQSAMAALAATGAVGGTLYFPSGTYKFTSSLQFGVALSQNNVRISGDGASSILRPTGAFSTSPCIEFRNINYPEFTEFTLDAQSRTGSGDNILLDGCSYGRVSACTISNATRYGVNLNRISGSSDSSSNLVWGNVYSGNSTANVFVKQGNYSNILIQATGSIKGREVYSVKDFGAVGDGVTDDTVAITAAIAASWRGLGNLYGRTLLFPAGIYKVTDTLSVIGKSGFHFVGEGKQATTIQWAGTGGGTKDLFYMEGCQLWSVENMTILGDASLRPRSLIRSHVPLSPVFSPYGMTFRDLYLSSSAVDGYDYGIWFDTAGPGNNSEVNYIDCIIERYKEVGILTEGAQAKAHCLYGVELSTGKYGWRSYSGVAGDSCPPAIMIGGGIGSCTVAAIATDYPSDHMLIEGVQSEHCYRFYDQGGSQGTGVFPLTIRNCRLAMSLTTPAPAFSSYIRLNQPGPVIFECNTIDGGTDGIPQIQTDAGAPITLRLSSNFFASRSALASSPINNSAGYQNAIDYGSGNFYRDAADLSYKRRLEPLDVAPASGIDLFSQSGNGRYLLTIPTAKFIAAATSQTIQLCTLPKGALIKMVGFSIHAQYALPAAPTISFKLGTTSGGNELLVSADVSTTSPVFYGNASGDLGATMAAPVQGGVANYLATQILYLTATSTAGNLGTGAATRMTAGTGFLVLEAIPEARFLV